MLDSVNGYNLFISSYNYRNVVIFSSQYRGLYKVVLMVSLL